MEFSRFIDFIAKFPRFAKKFYQIWRCTSHKS